MNTSPNVLEILRLLRSIGMDIFFNQITLYDGVTQGDNLEIQNAVFSKRKTSRNSKVEKSFISTCTGRSSSTSERSKFKKSCDFDFTI